MCERQISTEFYGVLTCDLGEHKATEAHHAKHPGGESECSLKGKHAGHGATKPEDIVDGEHKFKDLKPFEIKWFSEFAPVPSSTTKGG